MPLSDVEMLMGGPQGAGLETVSHVLIVALAYNGYGVLSGREYHSNIKGRHSYILLRVSSCEVPKNLTYPVDVLAAMDPETVFMHYAGVLHSGFLVYDVGGEDTRLDKIVSMESYTRKRIEKRLQREGVEPVLGKLVEYLESKGVKVVGLDYRSILSELRERHGIAPYMLSRFTSSVIVGAIAGLIGLDEESLRAGFSHRFAARKQLVEPNVYIAAKVAEHVSSKFGPGLILEESMLQHEEYMVVSGNEAVAVGKIIGGLRFQSYYPITPAQDESFFLESHEKLTDGSRQLGSVLVLQTEDEIAAIAAAMGAALAGARAATATSGPGFDLMAEGLSWAGISEAPIVVTYYQRGGPSTGMPTRGAQSDLFTALFSGHGEFPRVVIASGDHLEALNDAVEALNIAERYQVPVIHLLDKFLANSIATIPIPDTSGMSIDRGKLVTRVEAPLNYKRFSLDELVSPRTPLGYAVSWYTGDEHDEYGHIAEDPVLRVKMHSKRMRKMELIASEIPEEHRAQLYGYTEPDLLLIGWGSVKGVVLDAARILEKKGVRVSYLNIRYMSPFASKLVGDAIGRVGVDRTVAVEHSYEAHTSKLVAMNTGQRITKEIVKFTGRPIYMHELVDAVLRILDTGEKRVVLDYGA